MLIRILLKWGFDREWGTPVLIIENNNNNC